MMKVGADPEFFVLDPEGKPVPAHKFFPPKQNKTYCEEQINGARVYQESFFRDGFALEANATAGTCCAGMQSGIRMALRQAEKLLPAGYRLDARSTIEVDLGMIASPDTPEDVKTFGCEPSRNAYRDGDFSLPPIDASSHPFRYAGGHFHFSTAKIPPGGEKGYNPQNSEVMSLVEKGEIQYGSEPNLQWMWDPSLHPLAVKLLDLWVGLPLAYFQEGIPGVFQRRQFYGKAGEFRTQKYPAIIGKDQYLSNRSLVYSAKAIGIEYRVPSSETWRHNEIVAFALRLGRDCLRKFESRSKRWDSSIEGSLQMAINTGEGVGEMMKEFHPGLMPTLKGLRGREEYQSFQFTKLMGSFEEGFYEKVQDLPGCPLPVGDQYSCITRH